MINERFREIIEPDTEGGREQVLRETPRRAEAVGELSETFTPEGCDACIRYVSEVTWDSVNCEIVATSHYLIFRNGLLVDVSSSLPADTLCESLNTCQDEG